MGFRLPRNVGRYTLLECLGHGGMATVYRAQMRGVGRATKDVAIKLLAPQRANDRELELMFLDEMQLAMAMAHRNIIQTFDAGQSDDGRFFLVMELVEGGSLEQLLGAIEGKELLPLDLTLFIGSELCSALGYAHTLGEAEIGQSGGVIHRDVAPANVLLSRHGDVKLADFGIAKARGRLAVTASHLIKGKLSYMPPEQTRGQVGPQSDLFSVGAVLYEMTCGVAFRATTSVSVVARGSDPIMPPSQRRPGISDRLDGLILSCLSADPSQRPPSAKQLGDALAEEAYRLDQRHGYRPERAHERLAAFIAEHLPQPSAEVNPGGGAPQSGESQLAAALIREARAVETAELTPIPPGSLAGRNEEADEEDPDYEELATTDRPFSGDPVEAAAGEQAHDQPAAQLEPPRATAELDSDQLHREIEPPRATAELDSDQLHREVEPPRAEVDLGSDSYAAFESGGVSWELATRPTWRRHTKLLLISAALVAAAVAALVLAVTLDRTEPPPLHVVEASADARQPADHRRVQLRARRAGAASAAARSAAAATPRAAPASKPDQGTPRAPDSAAQVVTTRLVRRRVHRHRQRARRNRTKRRSSRAKRGGRTRHARRTRQATEPKRARGKLSINTRPWTKVYVEGRYRGNTPLQGVTVPAGRLRLRLHNPEQHIERTLTIRVGPGETVRKVLSLKR